MDRTLYPESPGDVIADRARLEARVAALVVENQRLRERNSAMTQVILDFHSRITDIEILLGTRR